MLSYYLTTGEGALVSCSLALIASVGLWKLIGVTRHVASRGLSETQKQCEIPECSEIDSRSICICGEQRFVILH
jgi:hypothetical protein